MVDTISKIMGDYGLTQNATADPYASQEKIIEDSVRNQLKQVNSSNREIASTQGFDTSFFDNGQAKKQETDILSNLYNTFAQNRINDINAEKTMERNIVQNQAISNTNTAASIATINATQASNSALSTQNYQQTVGTIAASQGIGTQQQSLNTQSGLTQQQIDLQKAQLMGGLTTTDASGKSVFQSTEAAKEFAKQFGLQEASIIGTYGTDSKNEAIKTLATKQLEQQQVMQSQMIDYYKNKDENSYNQLMGYTDNKGVKHIGTIQAQTNAQIDIINKQYANGESSADAALSRQIGYTDSDGVYHGGIIDANYRSQVALVNQQYANAAANMSAQQAAQYAGELENLKVKLQIERDNASENIRNTFYSNLATQGVSFMLTNGLANFGASLMNGSGS